MNVKLPRDIIEILKLALGKKKIEGESEISFYPEDLQIEFQVNKDIRKIVDSKLKQSNKIVLRNLANIIWNFIVKNLNKEQDVHIRFFLWLLHRIVCRDPQLFCDSVELTDYL